MMTHPVVDRSVAVDFFRGCRWFLGFLLGRWTPASDLAQKTKRKKKKEKRKKPTLLRSTGIHQIRKKKWLPFLRLLLLIFFEKYFRWNPFPAPCPFNAFDWLRGWSDFFFFCLFVAWFIGPDPIWILRQRGTAPRCCLCGRKTEGLGRFAPKMKFFANRP